ncbi:hypothetical protein M1555_03680 [Patescibacteria group bacterium]|nr:hypothetical protein [Patescibacteria group bacterium]
MNVTLYRLGTETVALPDAAAVTIPASGGELEILDHHAEAFFLLAPGHVTVTGSGNGDPFTVPVEGGGCHVKDNAVRLFIDRQPATTPPADTKNPHP